VSAITRGGAGCGEAEAAAAEARDAASVAAAASAELAAVRLQVRRYVCGFVLREDGEGIQPCGAKGRAMLRVVRALGLEVQRVGKAVAAAAEEEMAKVGKAWDAAKRFGRRWITLTRLQGPDRVAQLRELNKARDRARNLLASSDRL
jgi:hypothetical protein